MIEFILYVKDQERSSKFYSKLFRQTPTLNVPGMTEFTLNENCKLGLMPTTSIADILDDKTPHPDKGDGIPRCEIYIYTTNIDAEYINAVNCEVKILSEVDERSWGDRVFYLADPDGHIIAFAVKPENII